MMNIRSLSLFLLATSLCVSAQTIPLKLSQTTLQFEDTTVKIEVPSEYEQSFIKGPGFETYSYSGDINRFMLEISLQIPDEIVMREIENGHLKDIVTEPYSNKAQMLFGEYHILSQSNEAIEYTSYLKKQADGYLPAMYFRFHEYYRVKERKLLKISCRIQGMDSEKVLTDNIFSTIDSQCTKIIKSTDF